MTDVELLTTGTDETLSELERRHEQFIINYVWHWTGPHKSVAENIRRDVFGKVHLNRAQFKVDQPFKPWLISIIYSTMCDALEQWRLERGIA